MAISVLHNPSDNKLRGLLQVLSGRLPQGAGLRLGGTADLSGTLRGLGLRLPQQLLSALRRAGPRLLQKRKSFPLRIGDKPLRLGLGGRFALFVFSLHLGDLLDCFQGHPFSPSLLQRDFNAAVKPPTGYMDGFS